MESNLFRLQWNHICRFGHGMDFWLPHTQTPYLILPIGTQGAKKVEASQQKQPWCLHRGHFSFLQCWCFPCMTNAFCIMTRKSHRERQRERGREWNSTFYLVIGQKVWPCSSYRLHVFAIAMWTGDAISASECTGFTWLLVCSKTTWISGKYIIYIIYLYLNLKS